MSSATQSISVSAVHDAVPTSEGDGALVYRTIGTRNLRSFDPFLMLDEFHVRKPAGFPQHPHRGMETVTFMVEGAFSHKDFLGRAGTIRPGDLQWMTAGRGIVHSEMPATEGLNRGLQLWVNLSKKDKMCEAGYQELKKEDIPSKEGDGVVVHVIAGKSMGIESPVYTRTPTMYIDVHMEKGATFVQAIPEEYKAFAYVLEGTGTFGENNQIGKDHQIVLFGAGNSITIRATRALRFVIIGGKPLNEPV
jgi:redox-sensitive bicupin YhaK (pirin superfamily)